MVRPGRSITIWEIPDHPLKEVLKKEHEAHAGTNTQPMIYQISEDNNAHHAASPSPVWLSLNLFQALQDLK